MCHVFLAKDEPLLFPIVISGGNLFPKDITSKNVSLTVISGGNLFPTVISSKNMLQTVINRGNVLPKVISGENKFPLLRTVGNTVSLIITSRNNCAWADATACFTETLIRRSRRRKRKPNIVNSTWTWWDVVYLVVLCVLIFAISMAVWFDKHFILYAVSTSGYVFHASLMIQRKLNEIHDFYSHK